MKKIISKSYKRELMICLLIVGILPLLFCCAFLVQLFKLQIGRAYDARDLQQQELVNERFTKFEKAFDAAGNEISKDENVIQFIKRDTFGTELETDAASETLNENSIYSILYGRTGKLRGYAQCDLYSYTGKRLFSTGAGLQQTQLPVYWGILEEVREHPEEMSVRKSDGRDSDGGILLRFARGINDSEGNCIGFFIAGINEENFEKLLEGVYESQEGICILSRYWETVFSTGIAKDIDIGNELRQQIILDNAFQKSKDDYHVSVSSVGKTDLKVVLLRQVLFTDKITRTMYMVIIVMALFSALLCILTANKMSSSMVKPLNELNRAVRTVRDGNLDVEIRTTREDEVGQLAANFNVMTQELKDNIKKQVDQQKKLNEVSIAMMQAQLNPHFLYNTLDTMKWVAKANGIQEIAVLAAKLAKILRTSISKAQFIPLKEEFALAESYADIQRIRFQDRFSFEEDLPEELQDIMVPKLVIQPLVENAVIHGLENSTEGHVMVQAMDEGRQIHIEVRDDGCGISEEMIRKLRENDFRRDGHLGLYNVNAILKLRYGEGYGVEFSSRTGGGTCVSINIPKTGETDHADEGNGR